jgi:hypothetical protein
MPVTLCYKIVHVLVKYWKFYELWNFAAAFSSPTSFYGTKNSMDNLKTNFGVFGSLLGRVIIKL